MNIIQIINEEIMRFNEEPTEEYYRGVGTDEAIKAAQVGHLIYKSRDPMSRDWEVIKYGLGDEASEMSEEEIENYVETIVDWKPSDEGVNLTTDFENAAGYSPVVIGIDTIGNVAMFSEYHVFAEKPEQCIVKYLYVEDTNTRQWHKFTPKEFLKNINSFYP